MLDGSQKVLTVRSGSQIRWDGDRLADLSVVDLILSELLSVWPSWYLESAHLSERHESYIELSPVVLVVGVPIESLLGTRCYGRTVRGGCDSPISHCNSGECEQSVKSRDHVVDVCLWRNLGVKVDRPCSYI